MMTANLGIKHKGFSWGLTLPEDLYSFNPSQDAGGARASCAQAPDCHHMRISEQLSQSRADPSHDQLALCSPPSGYSFPLPNTITRHLTPDTKEQRR